MIESGVTLFGQYNIIKPIGKGGSSTVYLAKNIKVGNLVAIKVVGKAGKAFDLLAEKDILKELRHPSIPLIMDIEEDETYIYLVEEYVEGIALRRLKLQLSEKEIIHIMVQLCDVLSYLHTSFQVPIIYRDLKPSNIIRMKNGHVKLIDFGIAKRYEINHVEDTHAYGTRGYAAPEQFGQAKTDTRTDIFALGVCMYDMLTGKNLSMPPYKLKPIREVDSTISSQFEHILKKCMESLPSKRYQTAGYLQEALKAVGGEEKHQQDYETFKAKGQQVMSCMGISPRIGTTHVTIMLATYLQQQGKKVAIIEWQQTETFSKIAMMHEDIKENRHTFELNQVDYYFYHNKNNYRNILKKTYDVILLDCGYEEELSKSIISGNQEILLICGSKDWEMDDFENYYYGNPDSRFHYCFNFTDTMVFEELSENMDGFKRYLLPYNPNPYKLVEASKQIFAQILGESRDGGLGYKEGENGKKTFVRKIFKRLKRR